MNTGQYKMIYSPVTSSDDGVLPLERELKEIRRVQSVARARRAERALLDAILNDTDTRVLR